MAERMKVRVRKTHWADPWGLGIYGQNWRTHFQISVALLWWSFIIELRRVTVNGVRRLPHSEGR